MSHSESAPLLEERRTQVRIRVQIPATLILPGRSEPLPVRSEDLSWGGLLLNVSRCLPTGVDRVRLELSWTRNETLGAEAQVLRARPLLDGHYLVALRFLSLSHHSQSRLENLLQMLRRSAAPADRAGPAGLVRELEVVANDRGELREMLERIAKGRLTLTVFDAYEVGQSISFSIAGTEQLAGIRLRASVAEVKTVAAPGFDWASLYDLALVFEHPRDSVRGVVRHLLGQLPESEAASGPGERVTTAEPPPEPASRVPMSKTVSRPGRTAKAPAAGATDVRCALEIGFPEALNYLTAGWGDVQAFETLFRDVALGDHFQLGGWPMEVWAELTLLQDVHDLAYGISPLRTNVLDTRGSI